MRSATIFLVMVAVAGATLASAELPRVLSYQGVLRDDAGSPVPNGDYMLTFALYETPAATDPVWTEVDTVEVIGGLFHTRLGDVMPLSLPFDEAYWLGTRVEEEPELVPRLQLAAAAYALRAAVADVGTDADWEIAGNDVYRLEGNVGVGTAGPSEKLHIEGTARVAGFKMPTGATEGHVFTSDATGTASWQPPAAAPDGDWVVTGDHLSAAVSGNVGIGTANPGRKLEVHGDVIAVTGQYAASLAGNSTGGSLWSNDIYDPANPDNGWTRAITWQDGDVGIATTTPTERLEVNGTVKMTGFCLPTGVTDGYVLTGDATGVGTWQAATGGVGGSGSTGYVPKFTGSTTLANSVVYETGGQVGVGTTSPECKLDVAGDMDAAAYRLNGMQIAYRPNDEIWRLQALSGGGDRVEIRQSDVAVTVPFTAAGTIHSQTGGFRFPDGSIQTTAAGTGSAHWAASAGDIYSSNSGNVGIGDSSPSAKLDVAGTLRIHDRIAFSRNGYWADLDLLSGQPGGYPRLYIYETPGGGSRTQTGQYNAGVLSIKRLRGITASSEDEIAGVYGEATATSGNTKGVTGITHSPSAGHSGSSAGVYGWAQSTTYGDAFGVLGRCRTKGGSGNPTSAGVFGWGEVTSGETFGVWGESSSGTAWVSGVYGAATHTSALVHGVWGRTYSSHGDACGIYYTGGISGTGKNTNLVETTRGLVEFHAQESTESWFEDFGEGQLSAGQAHVDLDPVFLETVMISNDHPMSVFAQLNDDCRGVYVTRGTTGFDVTELGGGTSNARFTYRVVAKRRGFEQHRLEVREEEPSGPRFEPGSGS